MLDSDSVRVFNSPRLFTTSLVSNINQGKSLKITSWGVTGTVNDCQWQCWLLSAQYVALTGISQFKLICKITKSWKATVAQVSYRWHLLERAQVKRKSPDKLVLRTREQQCRVEILRCVLEATEAVKDKHHFQASTTLEVGNPGIWSLRGRGESC